MCWCWWSRIRGGKSRHVTVSSSLDRLLPPPPPPMPREEEDEPSPMEDEEEEEEEDIDIDDMAAATCGGTCCGLSLTSCVGVCQFVSFHTHVCPSVEAVTMA